jgi:L-ascorbate metabolism protein UlaG (beta-lactamase superfamily)
VAYLGIGQLGLQDEDYIRTYWAETVQTVGAKAVVLIHWDDFFRPLDKPLRALPYAGDDLNVTMRVFGELAADQHVRLHFPTVWQREDPWASGR